MPSKAFCFIIEYGVYSIMRQNVCEGDMFTCIDMHKNSKMRHSISLRKFDRVFANQVCVFYGIHLILLQFSKTLNVSFQNLRALDQISKRNRVSHFRIFEHLKCLIQNFRTLQVSHFRICERSIKFSRRNRVSHFRIFIHIDARELSFPLTLCCIKEYSPYILRRALCE